MELRITTLMASGNHREALEALVQAYGDAVGRYCTGLVGSRAEAEELLQEALIEAYGAMARYRGASTVRCWFFGIARRVCIQHLRKRDRQRSLLARWFSPPSSTAPGKDLVEESEEREALEAALHTLKPHLREAVLLRYVGDLDAVELGAVLGVSHATARKRVSLGVQDLRALLRPVLMRAREPSTKTKENGHGEPLPAPVDARVVRP